MHKGRTLTNGPEDRNVDDDALGFTERWQILRVKKQGGSGIANIEKSVDESIRKLEDYVQKIKERIITSANNSTDNMSRNWTIGK